MSAIRVLLADDHDRFRMGLAKLLAAQRDFELVGEAGDGAEAVEMARELVPDVILMDLSIPRVDGLEATRRIKAEVPCVRVVILTSHDSDPSVFDAVRSGAHGYVLKSAEPTAMLRTVREVARGQASISPTMAASLLEGLGASFPNAAVPPRDSGLTPREHETLHLIARGRRPAAVAETLGIAESTLGRVLQNILEKLYLESRVEAALRAVRERQAGSLPAQRPG